MILLSLSLDLQHKTVLHAGEALSTHKLCEARASLEAASVHHHSGALPGSAVVRQVLPLLAGIPLLPDHDGAHTTATGIALQARGTAGGKCELEVTMECID